MYSNTVFTNPTPHTVAVILTQNQAMILNSAILKPCDQIRVQHSTKSFYSRSFQWLNMSMYPLHTPVSLGVIHFLPSGSKASRNLVGFSERQAFCNSCQQTFRNKRRNWVYLSCLKAVLNCSRIKEPGASNFPFGQFNQWCSVALCKQGRDVQQSLPFVQYTTGENHTRV